MSMTVTSGLMSTCATFSGRMGDGVRGGVTRFDSDGGVGERDRLGDVDVDDDDRFDATDGLLVDGLFSGTVVDRCFRLVDLVRRRRRRGNGDMFLVRTMFE